MGSYCEEISQRWRDESCELLLRKEFKEGRFQIIKGALKGGLELHLPALMQQDAIQLWNLLLQDLEFREVMTREVYYLPRYGCAPGSCHFG